MELKGQARDLKENLKAIRKAGDVPAVFYGHKTDSTPVTVKSIEFMKLYKEAGRSSIFSLDIDGEKMDVLVKKVDYHPVKDTVEHIDFYVPTRGEEMEADVPFEFVGDAPAEKAGHILNKIMMSAKVKTLPRNLPDHIDISIEELENVGDSISLGDVKMKEGVSFIEDTSEIIISVTAAKTAEEEDEKNANELELPEEEVEEKEEESK